VRIVWLRAAERNLEEQLEDLGERNPPAADRLADKIATTVARLADHPDRGRPEVSRELASWSYPACLTSSFTQWAGMTSESTACCSSANQVHTNSRNLSNLKRQVAMLRDPAAMLGRAQAGSLDLSPRPALRSVPLQFRCSSAARSPAIPLQYRCSAA
jgi:ParE toxin of type II toxin-antitoxin system, parDE